MDIVKEIAKSLEIKESQVQNTIKLIDEGNTIPFIARYRKEVTGALDDAVLRLFYDKLKSLRALDERRGKILAAIEELGALTDELKEKIEAANTMVSLEDLYAPYKKKKKTRASVAKAAGLEPLANMILDLSSSDDIDEIASDFLNPEAKIETASDALAGARDIIAESISDDADIKGYIRKFTFDYGLIVSSLKSGAEESDEAGTYEMYYEYEESIKKIPSHRILAINRGGNDGVLSVKVEVETAGILEYIRKQMIAKSGSGKANVDKKREEQLIEAIADAYKRLIAPSVERDIRNELTENASDKAIDLFAKNLRALLMAPPLAGRTVLGWDPAFRTGCKLAVVDATGKMLYHTVIYPTAPQNKIAESHKILKDIIKKYNVSVISLGNGTASRESEAVIVDLISEIDSDLSYVIVNEAGASVYSASELATREFPNDDVGTRSACSIARRLQDPLAELVKIDPQAIGVGQYQHDIDSKKLSESLGGVVESCVNQIGVDLNTASFSLLEHIAGINKSIATEIVNYREANGVFSNRKELLKVAKLGPKAYEQCAGFLRISAGDNPLDATSVHPESYDIASQIIDAIGVSVSDIGTQKMAEIKADKKMISALTAKVDASEILIKDIIKELKKPARDPREDAPAPILKKDVLDMDSLTEGMVLKGTVRNVIDFGAFIDIGVHTDGLVHISQVSNKFIKHPLDVLSVGDVVDVKVLSVDKKKNRISLTMKL